MKSKKAFFLPVGKFYMEDGEITPVEKQIIIYIVLMTKYEFFLLCL